MVARMRGGVVCLIATGLLVIGGCVDDAGDSEPNAADKIDRIVQRANGEAPPYGAGAEVGRSYEYLLNIHCGVNTARIDGRSFVTEPIANGNGSPTEEWIEHSYRNSDSVLGTMRLVDRDSAIFEGGPEPVEFSASTPGHEPMLCR